MTLFIYEFIWFLSIFTYAYTLIKIWTIEKCIEMLQNCMAFKTEEVVKTVYIIMIGFIFGLHWKRNMLAHISLCRDRILAVSKLGSSANSNYTIMCCCLFFTYRENQKLVTRSTLISMTILMIILIIFMLRVFLLLLYYLRSFLECFRLILISSFIFMIKKKQDIS